MAVKPILLRRRGGAKSADPEVPAPIGVPAAAARPTSEVVLLAAEGKISTSTLPIYTILPQHRFRR